MNKIGRNSMKTFSYDVNTSNKMKGEEFFLEEQILFDQIKRERLRRLKVTSKMNRC